MGKKKKKKKILKHKFKIFLILIIFGTITLSLGYNLFNNLVNIVNMNKEKVALEEKIVELKSEKTELENDILKLENSDYIAKYVREKYFYSKDGELILRMDK